jgi:hypothetical protein
MVDAVVRHNERLGVKNIQFYADDGVLWGESGQIVQSQMDLISSSFASLGLKMNAKKTEFMAMTGNTPIVTVSDRAFNRKRKGEGLSHREYSLEKVDCPLCGSKVNRQYLKKHQKTAKCQELRREYVSAQAEQSEQTICPPVATHSTSIDRPPETYEFNMPGGGAISCCPVDGCPYATQFRPEMRRHFRHRHPKDLITIAEDVELHTCEACGFRGSATGLSLHRGSKNCAKLAKRRNDLAQRERQTAAASHVFTVDGTPIKKVTEFKYLGRIVEENDDDTPAIRRNLKRARTQWGRFSRLLRRQKANRWAMSTFYKVIVASVLLYGSESWVISKDLMRELRSFHHRCARHVVRRHIRLEEDGTWTCPPNAAVLADAELLPVEAYIQVRKNTIMDFAKARPIYQEALLSRPVQTNGSQLVWWEQVHYVAPADDTVADNFT